MKNSEYDAIETALIKTLDSYEKEAIENKFSNDRLWTTVLKQRIGELGERAFNCKICTSGFKDFYDAEWLYDLVWYKETGNGNDRRLVDIPLIMECEWNKSFNQIKYDFEKLLNSNARHRLFVCNVHALNKNEFLKYFNDAITMYSLSGNGDRYLIAILDVDSLEFSYELILK